MFTAVVYDDIHAGYGDCGDGRGSNLIDPNIRIRLTRCVFDADLGSLRPDHMVPTGTERAQRR
jgi:hypothetical protein